MSGIKPVALDSKLDIIDQLVEVGADFGSSDDIILLVVDGHCFFQRDTCVNLAPESGWKCSKCGYDAEGFRGQAVNWNFCPKCGAVNQEVL